MSASEFSGVDLHLGSVTGFRSWQVDFEGKLKGVSHSDLWLPGENRSKCHGQLPKSLVGARQPDESFSDFYTRVDYYGKEKAWRGSHGIEDCTHGYYGFFEKDTYNAYGSAVTLNGIVEAYGEVVIGTKGFRADKARIVALSIEPHEGVWRLEPVVADRLKANYPAAAFFGSTLAMLSEFPLTAASEWAASEAA